MNLWVVLFTGLTTGALTCLAVQGGLLASVIANQKEEELDESGVKNTTRQDWLSVGMFLVAKLLSHALLGFFLGWLGSRLQLSLGMRLLFQFAAALFMIATALNLLDAHPIFRYVVIQPPKFLRRLVKKSTKMQTLFAPALLGFLTILIPCGVTQSMEVAAIASGDSFAGALILSVFVLGTSPLFALVGMATAKLSTAFRDRFMKIAAVLILFLAVSTINGILTVLDSPITFQKMAQDIELVFFSDGSTSQGVKTDASGTQYITLFVTSRGYTPNRFQVKVGQPVRMTVQSQNAYSCAASFVFKAFNIYLELAPNDTQVVEFTPTKKGQFTFSCSMGMYSGVMEVI